jgi:predicted kinase
MIVISGSMGAGKTTVLGEASDLLVAAAIAHAAIDLDGVAAAGLSDEAATDLVYRNLRSLYANVVDAGLTRVLLAEAVESRGELDRIRDAAPAADVVVCRLIAPVATLQQRLRTREPGMLQDSFVARAADLDRVLERAGVEDFTVVNDARSVTDVARELLQHAGWLDR